MSPLWLQRNDLAKTRGAVERPEQNALNWQILPSTVSLKYDKRIWKNGNPKVGILEAIEEHHKLLPEESLT